MVQQLPSGFSYLTDPRMFYDIVYANSNNFLGRPIAGYQAAVCIASDRVIAGVIAAQDALDELNLGLAFKIFDAYRPQTAVDDFVEWSKDLNDQKMKDVHYPNVSKEDLFKLNYLVLKSRHSTGSAIDLTIVKRDENNPQQYQELDMGTPFDFFDEASHTTSGAISQTAQLNRQMLKILMERHGFKNYPYEWWHFNLVADPFPDTHFNFPIA